MVCATERFEELGYEFLDAPSDTTDRVGHRRGANGLPQLQELVRLEAKLEDQRPTLTMTVGRLSQVEVVQEGSFPASGSWMRGPRSSMDQADQIIRNCQGSPFRG